MRRKSPADVPAVEVEWLDITGDPEAPGLLKRWSEGWLLSVDFESHGRPCVVIATTWDEQSGFTEYSTFPVTVVENYDRLVEELACQ